MKKSYWLTLAAAICLIFAAAAGFYIVRERTAQKPDESAAAAGSSPSASVLPSAAAATAAASIPTAAAEDEALNKLLEKDTAGLGGKWDIYAESLPDGRAAHCLTNTEEGEPLVSASLIKLFIMGTVFDSIEKGKISQSSVSGLLNKMITISDNDSANSLIKLLGSGSAQDGMQAVNDWADSIGCSHSRLNRLMLDNNGLQNYTTAEDCAAILRLIYGGKCVSEKRSAQMLELLKAQTVDNRIPAQLPEGTVTAHKTGDLLKICCADAGIVFSPKCDYLLCMICNDPANDKAAADKEAEISAEVYAYYNAAAR